MRGIGPFLVVSLALSLGTACAPSATVPDPRGAATAWADAIEKCSKGEACDTDAIHGMLTKRSQAAMPKAEVAAMVKDSKVELANEAKAIRESKDHVETVAILRYEDGTAASLVLEGDRFRIANGVLFPGPSKTPEEAVAAFRTALQGRSYPALLRLLSPSLRASVEAQLGGIEGAIPTDPKKVVPSDPKGDVIDIPLENGHRLRLKRIDGSWYIDDFE